MNKNNLYSTLEIPGSFLVPAFCIYVLEISGVFDNAQSVTSISTSATKTQSPLKNRVVESSEQSEEGIETTIKGGFDNFVSDKYSATNKKKWFYIGMTGDPHYPSARAAFHRISGHLELSKRSTQNQLRIALKEKLGIVTDDDLRKITIKMHHYPIEGFTRITDKQLDNETVQQLKLTPAYKEYKKIQQQVLALENALIFELKDKLLNKTEGVAIRTSSVPYPQIYKSIIELVNNG